MEDRDTRVGRLRGRLDEQYGASGAACVAVHAPARSEIAGNHTDHEGGRVIAGALACSIEAVARPNGTDVVRVASTGFEPIEVSLADGLEPLARERVSTAGLVRGMAHELAATGRTPAGLDLVMDSTIPSGGGLSSSAACEAALGRAMEALWEGAPVDAVTLAQMSQRTENDYFGKPCGLMDQLAVCLGGLSLMDFSDPALPRTERLELDFADLGWALCLIDVGCDHSRFTDEYAAVPTEMHAVAQALGAERLCEVDEASLYAHLPELRRDLGDRAVLRALHYWREDELVDGRWEALKARDMPRFLELTERSGASSGMFLQNVACGTTDQPAMMALALGERALAGREAALRIHGGGFGGSIQAFVPLDALDEFTGRMDSYLGEGACQRHDISAQGASAAWL